MPIALSRKHIPAIAGFILSVAFGVALAKDWFNWVPDPVIWFAAFVALVMWAYWLATHEIAKHPAAKPIAFVLVVNIFIIIAGHYSPDTFVGRPATPLPERIIAPPKTPVVAATPAAPKPKPTPQMPPEKDDADLEAVFTHPAKICVSVKNISNTVAWDTKFDVELWNLEEPRNKNADTGLGLPIFAETARGDFVKPGWGTRPRTVLDAAETTGRLKDGDRLIGFGGVTCSNCKSIRWYWVFYVEGKGGWYSPIPIGQGPNPKVFGTLITNTANGIISAEDFAGPQAVKLPIVEFP
jgi:hypothetical protein